MIYINYDGPDYLIVQTYFTEISPPDPRKKIFFKIFNQRTNGPVNAHLRPSYHFFDVKAYVSIINLAVK